MFERISQLAERTATSASRRQFLGSLGRGAWLLAGAVAGMVAFPTNASAAQGCCWGRNVYGNHYCYRHYGSGCGVDEHPCQCHKGCY